MLGSTRVAGHDRVKKRKRKIPSDMSNRVFWSAVTVSFRVLHACHSQWLRQFVALEWIRHVGGLLTALLPSGPRGLVGVWGECLGCVNTRRN